jgi:hypothetical protein
MEQNNKNLTHKTIYSLLYNQLSVQYILNNILLQRIEDVLGQLQL